MKKLLIYLEVLVLASLYRLSFAIFVIVLKVLKEIIVELAYLGRTADYYSERNVHFWEQNKIREIYKKEQEAKIDKKIKDIIGD